ncbi:DUF5677 domain-containing protein [Paraburkholderia sediminicola]|uniref:DUF5677 domain-containing protein n=1 Tax=Paraburkholderia sediminicola TaxID=458836 RepID=UPI0038BA2CF8
MSQIDAGAAWLEYADKLYDFSQSVLAGSSIPIGPKGAADPKVLAAALLVRTTSNFKGAVALVREGLVVESRTLVRCCFENLFWLGNLLADGDKFVKEMGGDDAKSMHKRLTFILDKELSSTDVTENRLRGMAADISEQWPKAKILNPKQVAQASPVKSSYLIYSQLSADSAHPSLTSLNRYIAHDQITGERGIDVSPIPLADEVALTVNWGCMALLGACVAFNQLVGQAVEARLLRDIANEFDAVKLKTGIE